jgi:hypothetical protein
MTIRRLLLLTWVCGFLLTVGPLIPTQAQCGAANKQQGDEYARRNLALEKAALVQRDKIEEMLPVPAKQKLDLVFEGFLRRLLREKNAANLAQIVKEELAPQFAELSPKQLHILTFYVVTGVIKKVPLTRSEWQAEKDKIKDKKDAISEMSEMDMLMLQQMMEKKGQLEKMISNMMKAGFEGGQAAIQALKAS